MVFAAIKKAYFAVTTIMTSIIMIGGFAIIIRNINDDSVNWAKELIMISLALWVPSPVDFIENSLEDARNELLGAKDSDKNKSDNDTSEILLTNKPMDSLTKRAINAVMQNINNQKYDKPIDKINSFEKSNINWDLENQLINTRETKNECENNSSNETNKEKKIDDDINIIIDIV
jgi:hypothetical protein